MESSVGLTVSAAVEPMPVGLAGGSRDGTDAAQGGEGGFGAEAVRVTPSSDEEGRRRVWAYAEAIHQGWGCRLGESMELGLQVLYLIAELTVATSKGAKSIPGRRGGILQTTGLEALAPGDKGSSGEATEALTELGRGRDDQSLHLVESLGAGLDSRVPGALEHADHFDFTLT